MKITCLTYEHLRKKRPELKLPAWQDLTGLDRRRAKRMTITGLQVRRFTVLIARDPGVVDRLRFRPGLDETLRNRRTPPHYGRLGASIVSHV